MTAIGGDARTRAPEDSADWCSYGLNRIHRHGPGGNKCIWCGSTANGAGCLYSLTRGAGAGQQRFATSVWSGDIASNWDMLRKQVPGGLNYTDKKEGTGDRG